MMLGDDHLDIWQAVRVAIEVEESVPRHPSRAARDGCATLAVASICHADRLLHRHSVVLPLSSGSSKDRVVSCGREVVVDADERSIGRS